MNWKEFFKLLVRNVLGAMLVVGAVLGVFGFLVAGKVGLVNGLSWGLVLGFLSVPFTTFIIFQKFWGDYSGRFGSAWFKDQAMGDDPDKRERD